MTAFVDGMAERDIPLSVFHYDCFWMREYQWSDFEWDARAFHDPVGQIARMHERDVHVSVWINPYIAQRSALFREAADNGYLLLRTDGSVWQWDMWQAGMGLVDFTNPDAADWYVAKLQGLLDQGVDAFKTDFGERIPVEGVVWHDGSDPHRMHNYYAKLYNEVVFRALERHHGVGDAVVFARSATAGSQQFPVHWGGDNDSTFLSMAESLRGGLSLAMSGFGYWSHDIGGFEGTPDPGLFKRWLAFGLLSSHSRPARLVVRARAVGLRRRGRRHRPRVHEAQDAADAVPRGCRRAGAHEGTPMMRPHGARVPRRPLGLRRRHPVHAGRRAAGRTGVHRRRDGGVLRARGAVDLPHRRLRRGRPPLGRRDTTATTRCRCACARARCCPSAPTTSRPDYDWADGVTLRCFELPDGYDAVTTVPGHDAKGSIDGVGATTFRVRREGAAIIASSDDARAPWALQVGERIDRAEASGEIRIEIEEDAR